MIPLPNILYVHHISYIPTNVCFWPAPTFDFALMLFYPLTLPLVLALRSSQYVPSRDSCGLLARYDFALASLDPGLV